jgi:hypothetical protein
VEAVVEYTRPLITTAPASAVFVAVFVFKKVEARNRLMQPGRVIHKRTERMQRDDDTLTVLSDCRFPDWRRKPNGQETFPSN